MKNTLIMSILLLALSANGQAINQERLASLEQQLEDVVEIIDPELVKGKQAEVEHAYRVDPSKMNKLRLGLIYHEIAFNLTFLDKTKAYAGYAQRSFDILTELARNENTPSEWMVFIQSYRASALSLVSSETMKLGLLSDAFDIFEETVDNYAEVSPRPEFMRGSVAENLPWFMWRKRRYAKQDFASIIEKQDQNPNYADSRIMSFSYWAWAKAHQKKQYRKQAINYLNKAIEIDPDYQAGRKRAEELKAKLTQK